VSSFLLDTHTWAWSLTGDRRLSRRAIETMQSAEAIFVSPISLFEIGQKVRIGKWPDMEPFVDRLPGFLQEQGGRVAGMTPEICLAASMLAWDHRDPFDRFLAVTSIENRIAIISADEVFDELADHDRWIARIW
jgi:PIN domain nuclease of toxin-antitoxin system